MGNKFGSPYQKIQAKTADYTVVDGDHMILVTAASANITITLPDPNRLYSESGEHGDVRIVNVSTSTFNVLVATAAGSVVGRTTIAPGQMTRYLSDGVATWYGDGSSSSGVSSEVQVSLSAANILALNATPITLVPAPGAGKVIIVESILLKMVTTSTQFANGGALEFRYTNASGAKVTADIAAAVVTAAAGTSYTSVAGVTTSLTNVANAAITVNNATAAFITGTGTAVVTIRYRIVTP